MGGSIRKQLAYFFDRHENKMPFSKYILESWNLFNLQIFEKNNVKALFLENMTANTSW